ncbi:XRE family transcriptional regulator [Rickettsiales endosymbiont of Peranema trichophorum]|uniref:helix-turn-helix domain-containing protein n=1 Tax=Rickettsiales endosymbiont of Peranema trichophorum TaxID=2486577 RepID=UPI001023228B|nr:helix-turn-helix transcriptional regulator [Rickettsiales endosymbiont of Peranema trichophorum]RZI47390.1 XRE family transcriptional regulator [Rickettsiales endosymbiont of Peranema trichophorum]
MLGDLLVRQRLKLGLSQDQIGRRAGVTPSTVSRWESNKISGPLSIPTIHKMSIGYDIPKQTIIKSLPQEQRDHLLKYLTDDTTANT